MKDWRDWPTDDFLYYMEDHSKTERALFHRDQVNRLLWLAHQPIQEPLPEWMSVYNGAIQPLVDKARAIKRPKERDSGSTQRKPDP